MLLAKDGVEDNLVWGKIGKNRSGRSNLGLEMQVNFEKYSFKSLALTANPEKSSKYSAKDSCNAVASFTGFGDGVVKF
jgi:hypothetical protein